MIDVVVVGCWHCGARCPHTNETVPALTKELGQRWFEDHRNECPVPDWPGSDREN